MPLISERPRGRRTIHAKVVLLILLSILEQVNSMSPPLPRKLYDRAALTIASTYTDVGGETAVLLGCYTDSGGSRTLPVSPTTAQLDYTSLTPASCSYACAKRGLPLSGTEYGSECYCGSTIASNLYLGPDTTYGCNMACIGDSTKSCGSGNNLLVYNTTLLATVAPALQQSFVDVNQQAVNYLGCYTDSNDQRTLPYQISGDAAMSPTICSLKCGTLNFIYSGVEYGSQCFCGNSAPAAGLQVFDTSCNMPCTSNSLVICGGGNRLNVYAVSIAAVNLPTGYQGCYSNLANRFALPALRTPGYVSTIGGLNMTVNLCVSQCASWKFKYAGIAAGNQCSCGQALEYTTLLTSTCTTPCAGNPKQLCGGLNAISLYTTGATGLSGSDALVASGWIPTIGYASLSGCYYDQSGIQNPILPTPVILAAGSVTPAACIIACASRGFSVSGVEYSSECYCGSTVPNTRFTTLGNCYMPCSGNASLVCGGPNALTIYSNSNVTGTTIQLSPVNTYGPYTSLGCFVDAAANRALSYLAKLSGSMTPASCLAACQTLGYPYAGVEYAWECYCDIAIGGAAASGALSTNCKMPCQGSPLVTCGGGNAIQIFYAPTLVRTTLLSYPSNGVIWSYQSCWGEPANARAFPNRLPNPTKTVQGCLDAGNAAGYKACGLEYGGECWCGSDAPGGGLISANSTYCITPCIGDSLHYCGGGFTLTRYSTSLGTSDLGCYVDGSTIYNTGNRLLPINAASNTGYNENLVTPNYCANQCATLNYAYSGVEYGRECYCSSFMPYGSAALANTAGNSAASVAAGCSSTCIGDSSIRCGGGNRLTVTYAPDLAQGNPATITTASTRNTAITWTNMGCIIDTLVPRTLEVRVTISTLSLPSCMQAASTLGYAFAAMEFGQECWASNTPPAPTLYDLSMCNTPCQDDPKTFCGGGSGAMSYYSTQTPKYLGCYTDTANPRPLTVFQSSTNVTAATCAASCAQSGYIYSGVEYYGQCFCGNTLDASLPVQPDSSCNTPCTYDATQMCGGSSFMGISVVYSATSVTIAGLKFPNQRLWTYRACYADQLGNRTLPIFLINNSATVQQCLYNGIIAGYPFCGLEYGGQCFCATSAPANPTLSTSCNVPCTSNPAQICGGAASISYYTYG